MSGSSSFHLELPDSFKKSVETFEDENYGKKERKGRDEARTQLQELLEALMDWPSIAGNRNEPFPGRIGETSAKAGWLFQKLEFSAPRLNGAARQGRLMYLVNKDAKAIIAVCIYTHKQFKGRVPEKTLEEMVQALIASAEALREKNKKRQQETQSAADPEKTT